MQPVWSVENAVVAMEDGVELGIVGWSKPGSDSVGKTDEGRIAGSFARVDVAQLIRRSAGNLSTVVGSQTRRADSLRFRRIEDAIKKRRIKPLKFIGGKEEELVLDY